MTLKLAIDEAGSDAAAGKWDDWVRGGVEILAPELIWYELTSILAKYRKRGDITETAASEALETLLALKVTTVGGGGLHRQALSIAARLDHTAAYDAHYLAVAEQGACPLWTADGGMNTAAQQLGVEVHLIS